jgi:endonuclease/exonuclease/phosphatase family metal-dependent hydrolase
MQPEAGFQRPIHIEPVRYLTLFLAAAILALPAPTPSLRQAKGVTIVTLNLAKETSSARILAEWMNASQLREADIFLLQEVREDSAVSCVVNRLGEALGMHVAFSPEGPGVDDRGLAILSRYPLSGIRIRPLKRFDLQFHSRARFALSAVANTPWGPVALDNVHLDTRLNAPERLAQLEPIVRDSSAGPRHRILAGDFNSNPFYWVRHVLPLPGLHSQAGAVDAYLRGQGFRSSIPASSGTSDFGMHLDWIWTSGLRSTGSRVLPLKFSDHHAVWTRVEFE